MFYQCTNPLCECCNPYLFREDLVKSMGYDGGLIPCDIAGAGVKDLFNLPPEEVFNYQWVIVQSKEEQEKIIAQKLPYISSMGFCKAVELTSKAA